MLGGLQLSKIVYLKLPAYLRKKRAISLAGIEFNVLGRSGTKFWRSRHVDFGNVATFEFVLSPGQLNGDFLWRCDP